MIKTINGEKSNFQISAISINPNYRYIKKKHQS